MYFDYRAISHDSLGARLDRVKHKGVGYCGRCGYTWRTVKGHVTQYNEHSGCFPLCEGCWELLGSPEARIEYYWDLILYWETQVEVSDDDKQDIKRAVANGG